MQKLIRAIDKEPDPKIQIPMLSTLVTIEGSSSAVGINHLIKLLDHKEKEVRILAVQGLGVAGERAKDAIPKLTDNLFGPDPETLHAQHPHPGRNGQGQPSPP